MIQPSKDFSSSSVFKEQVKKSFASCKEDILNLQEQQNSLQTTLHHIMQDQSSKQLQIQQMQESISQLLKMQNSLLEEIKDLKVNSQKEVREEIPNEANDFSTQSIHQAPQKTSSIKRVNSTSANDNKFTHGISAKDPYEALLEFKAKVNKKDTIKQKILSMIPNEGINSSELCFLFVEHFRYCSKATFYNYLKELEYSKQIRTQREESKNIIYLQGTMNIPEKKLHTFV